MTPSADPVDASHIASRGATISIRGLSHVYGKDGAALRALEHIDLDVAASAFITVLGPSGCGKSTLLNILAGFDTPTHGSVLVDGEALASTREQRGFVFQDSAALFPWLTVAQNVAFGLKNRAMSRATIHDRVSEALSLVGLDRFADRHPQDLSGGMRQLAAIARVLVLRPAVLLMDEPFAALDALTRQTMQMRLVEIWSEVRLTVVFITHSVDEAVFLGDELVVMSPRPGRVLERIPIRLARPRDATAADFNAIKAKALGLLGIC